MSDETVNRLFDLSGRVAIVTGGAMGIGRGIAFLLAHAGASVVIADIDAETAQKVAAQVEAIGPRALVVPCDVSNGSQVRGMVAATIERFGRVDILVNNAGVIPVKPVLEMEEEDWDQVLDINLKGTFLCAQAAARDMVQRGQGGKIVNLSSIDGVYPLLVGFAHYDSSKAAVIAFTKNLAKELAPHHVNVNAVAPGIVDTPGVWKLAAPWGLDPNDIYTPRIPWGRLEQPDDVARAVLFLASEAAEYITGTTLFVEGGFLVG